jgi:hypothetical protein
MSTAGDDVDVAITWDEVDDELKIPAFSGTIDGWAFNFATEQTYQPTFPLGSDLAVHVWIARDPIDDSMSLYVEEFPIPGEPAGPGAASLVGHLILSWLDFNSGAAAPPYNFHCAKIIESTVEAPPR